MGKHATEVQKTIFLVHLDYVYYTDAAQRAGLALSTTKDIKKRDIEICIDRHSTSSTI